jgi:NAD(P)-dependent dehydrogenase (short-subunit alcohol dehydrogenase family)
MRLDGKVALITGGGSGIGQATAHLLAQEGACVVITGRRNDRRQVQEMVAWVTREVGPVAILVNNAGVNVPRRSLAELSGEDWDRILQIDATGAFNVVQAVLPQMRARRDGVIVNISSLAGVRASTVSGAAYSAAKHALSALTRVISIEEREYGIRATNLCPGEVNTPILDERPVKVPDERKAQILQPEDVAAAVLFVVTLHPRAHVAELYIKPTIQPFS